MTDAADANDDGSLDVTDAIFSLSYQFLDGDEIPEPSVPAPWPVDLRAACGLDRTPGELMCEGFNACL
jgi:hypothetical protein